MYFEHLNLGKGCCLIILEPHYSAKNIVYQVVCSFCFTGF